MKRSLSTENAMSKSASLKKRGMCNGGTASSVTASQFVFMQNTHNTHTNHSQSQSQSHMPYTEESQSYMENSRSFSNMNGNDMNNAKSLFAQLNQPAKRKMF